MRQAIRALGVGLLVASGAHAACVAEKQAEVRLRLVENYPIVAATVGGTPVSFLLDTGSQGHLIRPEVVQVLGLAMLPGAVPVIGTGGAREAPVVMLDGVQLGGVNLPPEPAPVAELPPLPAMTPVLAGLLGAPLLDRFDLDLDVPGGRVGVYRAGACSRAVPVLGPRMTTIRLTVTPSHDALLPVQVNGQTLVALLDTGSRATLLTEVAGRRLGLRAPVSANTARGVDGERLPLEHVRVREMAVGDDVQRDVPVSIAPLQLGRVDMLLGLDYFVHRRAWISYATGQLVVALPDPAASAR